MEASLPSAADIAAIVQAIGTTVTPVMVVIVGWAINRSIQRQNHQIAQQSRWAGIWATQFLEVANSINHSITEVVVLCRRYDQFRDGARSHDDDGSSSFRASVSELMLGLERGKWELDKYIGHAEKNGTSVMNSYEFLLGILATIDKNPPNLFDTIRVSQIDFNNNVRLMHAELLELQR